MNCNHLSHQEIRSSLAIYGVSADETLCERINIYIRLLLKWNQKISLTTITNPAEILRFHFGESFFATSVMPIGESRLADVGSGAGFPGLAIRLLVDFNRLILIDSNAKKAAFLAEVSRELDLKNVDVFRGRMEEFAQRDPGLDFVTARALGQHNQLLEWSHSHLNSSGKIVLWLGEEDVSKILQNSAWMWCAAVKIPNSERRFILSGSPTK
jgi:16S rRNA (guanine527-N7)-methyltransferase